MAAAPVDIALVIDGTPVGRVERLSGREAVSDSYRFDVEVLCGMPPAQPETVLGAAARIDLLVGDGSGRRIHGIIVEWDVAVADSGWRLRAALVPRVWLGDQRPRTRSFRDLSAVDIAMALTADLRCPDGGSYVRADLGRSVKAAAVVQQTDETDLALIERLLTGAGLAYVFAHEREGERMVLLDRPIGLERAAGTPTTALAACAHDGLVRHGRLEVDADGQPVARADWHGTIRIPGLAPGMALGGAGRDGEHLTVATVAHTAERDGDTLAYTCRFEAAPAGRVLPEAAPPTTSEPGPSPAKAVEPMCRTAFAGVGAEVNEAPVPRHMAPNETAPADAGTDGQPDTGGASTAQSGVADGKSFNVLVPDYANPTSDSWNRDKSTYLRLGATNFDTNSAAEQMYNDVEAGAGNPDMTVALNLNDQRSKLDGWFDYTGGNHTSITMGNKEEVINKKRRLVINGGGQGVWDAGPQYFLDFSESALGWKKTVASQASSAEFSWGDNQSISLGVNFGIAAGFTASANVTGGLNYGLTADVDVSYGPSIAYGNSSNIDFTSGSSYSFSKSATTESTRTVTLGVLNKGSGASEHAAHKTVFGGVQAAMGVVGGLVATTQGGGIEGANTEVNTGAMAYRQGLETAQITSLAMWATAMAQYAAYVARAKNRKKANYQSVVHLSDSKVEVAGVDNFTPMGYLATQTDGGVFLGHMNGQQTRANAKGSCYITTDGSAVLTSTKQSNLAAGKNCYVQVESDGNITMKSTMFKGNTSVDVKNGTLKVL